MEGTCQGIKTLHGVPLLTACCLTESETQEMACTTLHTLSISFWITSLTPLPLILPTPTTLPISWTHQVNSYFRAFLLDVHRYTCISPPPTSSFCSNLSKVSLDFYLTFHHVSLLPACFITFTSFIFFPLSYDFLSSFLDLWCISFSTVKHLYWDKTDNHICLPMSWQLLSFIVVNEMMVDLTINSVMNCLQKMIAIGYFLVSMPFDMTL